MKEWEGGVSTVVVNGAPQLEGRPSRQSLVKVPEEKKGLSLKEGGRRIVLVGWRPSTSYHRNLVLCARDVGRMEPGIAGTGDQRGQRAPGDRYGAVLAAPQLQRETNKR